MKEIAVERTYTERTIQGYEAKDGTKFYSCNCMNLDVAKEECERYENSAYMIVRDRVQKFKIGVTTEYGLNEWGCDDNIVEIFMPETEDDVKNLMMYLQMRSNSSDPNFERITIGREIIIWWNYDFTWFGIDTYETWIARLHNNFNKAIKNYKEKKDGQNKTEN